MAPLPTNNEGWGFWGTVSRIEHPAADVARAWRIASTEIAAATGGSPEGVRDFLDSRDGRHFADDIEGSLCDGVTLPRAIGVAVLRWQGWKIDRKLSRETGIPAGLPYLTGLVNHFANEVEAV